MNNNNQIKESNRKALPKYILLMVVIMVIGAVIGFISGLYGFNGLLSNLKAFGSFFSMNVAWWLLVAIAIILPLVCIPLYRDANKMLDAWDGEDEEVSDAAEKKLSYVLWISSLALTVSIFLITASYSVGFAIFEDRQKTVTLIVSIVALVVIVLETVILQQKTVDATKKTNPEKSVSFYDTNFQKKWFDSFDEAERMRVGQAAYKAYKATNTTCAILAALLAIGALVLGISFLPALIVCIIWVVNQSAYFREATKESK